MSSDWYLEHVTTAEKIFLHTGDNVIGSSAFCQIILCAPFNKVARKHANLIINDDQVMLKPLTELKEIFIDDTRVENTIETPVTEGSVITLGIKTSALTVPGNRAVFTLKKMGSCVDEIYLLSDSEEHSNNKPPPRRSQRVRKPPLRYRSPKFLLSKRKR